MRKIICLSMATASMFAMPAFAGENYDGGMFNGFKVGVEAGLQSNKAKITAPGDVNFKKNKKGLALRAFAGYDLQLDDSFLVGGEIGLSKGGPDLTGTTGTANFKVDQGLTMDASARAGVLVSESMLLYGRVGYATSKFKISATNSEPTPVTVATDKRKGGLLFGVGTEFSISDSVGARIEYRRKKHGRVKSSQIMLGGIVRF